MPMTTHPAPRRAARPADPALVDAAGPLAGLHPAVAAALLGGPAAAIAFPFARPEAAKRKAGEDADEADEAEDDDAADEDEADDDEEEDDDEDDDDDEEEEEDDEFDDAEEDDDYDDDDDEEDDDDDFEDE